MPKSKDLANTKHDDAPISTNEYTSTLAELKKQIQECQLRAITTVNKELVRLYWMIGKTIVERQENSGWGSRFIEKLATDLQNEFPGIEGFSRANIFRMKAFFLAYKKVAQPVRQFDSLPIFSVPWGHNILLLQKLSNNEERLWYANKTLEHGWSRTMHDMLKHKTDNPTIGMLLCKSRNKVKAEYAFRDIKKPMGVMEYETMLTKALPEELKSNLPTIKEIEEELGKK